MFYQDYRFPDFPGIGQMQQPQQPQMLPGAQPQMMQSSLGLPGGQAPYAQTMNAGPPYQNTPQSPFNGIGMMSMLMPLLMGVMQPGMGGFQGIGAQPQQGLPPPSPRIMGAGPPAYAPQPTGGINRGSFPF